jgi:hypothetical protein
MAITKEANNEAQVVVNIAQLDQVFQATTLPATIPGASNMIR